MSTPNLTSPSELNQRIHQAIAQAGGWLPFDRFMAMALYEPGQGYYTNALQKFGAMPSSGSDFVTAPGMSPLFGQTVAVQVREALQATGTDEVWEFGAGTGALALQLLDSLGDALARYTIIDLSGTLRARQAETLLKYADKVRWQGSWPAAIEGVVVGNEVLDAMPVQLLQRTGGVWHERLARQHRRIGWPGVLPLRHPAPGQQFACHVVAADAGDGGDYDVAGADTGCGKNETGTKGAQTLEQGHGAKQQTAGPLWLENL